MQTVAFCVKKRLDLWKTWKRCPWLLIFSLLLYAFLSEYAQPLVSGVTTLGPRSTFKPDDGPATRYSDPDLYDAPISPDIYHAYAEPLPSSGSEYATPIVVDMGLNQPSTLCNFMGPGSLHSWTDSGQSGSTAYDRPKNSTGHATPPEDLTYQVPQKQKSTQKATGQGWRVWMQMALTCTSLPAQPRGQRHGCWERREPVSPRVEFWARVLNEHYLRFRFIRRRLWCPIVPAWPQPARVESYHWNHKDECARARRELEMGERKRGKDEKKKADYCLLKTLSLFCDFNCFVFFASCETVIFSILPSVTHSIQPKCTRGFTSSRSEGFHTELTACCRETLAFHGTLSYVV